MGIYASPQDVADRWGGYDEDEHEDRTEKLIGDAEDLLLTQFDLAGRIANGVITERTVMVVVVDMVKRILRNPEGFRQEDDGDYSYVYAPGALTPGEVGLTRADLRRLNGSRRITSAGPNDQGLSPITRRPSHPLVQDRGRNVFDVTAR